MYDMLINKNTRSCLDGAELLVDRYYDRNVL